ncbi:MAG: amidohydrolase family protein [Acidobacteria bacterium]|nr:amidohydrolase family protein [Acidobacteriota bacterium]
MSLRQDLTRPWTARLSATVVVTLLAVCAPRGQSLPPEVEQMGYADTVFINGKVISMDDASTSTSPGRIYQAIAVKGDRIMKLGTNDEIRALEGRITKLYDLKGRPLLPGIVEPHQHIYGGALRFAERFGLKWPPEGVTFVQATADKDLEKTQAIVRDTLRDTVRKVKKGDWIVLNVNPNPDQPRTLALWGYTRRLTNRKTLDVWAPDNPVLVRPSNRGNVNSKALEILNEFLPGYSASIQETMHGVDIGEDVASIGWVGSQEMAVLNWEVFLSKLDPNILAQMLKLQSEAWASLGVTTVATRIPFPKIMSGYARLAGLRQMPLRINVHYEVHRMPTDPKETRQFYRRTGALHDIGGDTLWIDGVASERWDSHHPEACMGPDVKGSPAQKARETCPHAGDLHWDVLQNAIKSGWRMTGVHMVGSEALRRMVQMVEGAMAASGLSLDYIRQQMFTFEHCDMLGKLPDTIEILKKYNFMISCGPNYISEARIWAQDYGPANPNIGDFLIPFNTWIKSGVRLVGQHYGGGAIRGGEGGGEGLQPPFFMLWQAITRKWDGKVWQPEERIDRVHALKMWTRWAADYVRHPGELGSLEAGKWADLLVIDRDYLTIPEDEILKIRPLMTMLGGKVTALNASLASEWGVQPAGNQYNFDDKDVEWIGKPVTEDGRRETAASRQ